MFQAVLLTLGVLATMLVVYRTGAIKATNGFKRGVIAATGAICLVYLVTMALRAFGIPVSFMHHDGAARHRHQHGGRRTIAALNLVLDFDMIEQGAKNGAPKHIKWCGTVGLLVTLVWLYVEILNLLSKLNRR